MKTANPREPLSGVYALMPAKKLKDTFLLLVLLHDQKYQKSARRTHAVLLPNHRGVHELVAGSSAWQVCTARGKAQVGGFAAPRNLILPRVRTYHTK